MPLFPVINLNIFYRERTKISTHNSRIDSKLVLFGIV